MFRSIWWQFSQSEFHKFRETALFMLQGSDRFRTPKQHSSKNSVKAIYLVTNILIIINYYYYNVVNYFHVPVFVDEYSVYFAVITC